MKAGYKLYEWLGNLGISETYIAWIIGVGIIIAVLLIAALVDAICKNVIIPAVRRITSKTNSIWDDHLLGDDVIKNIWSIIPATLSSVIVSAFMIAGSEATIFLQKLCSIYITVVIIKLICSFISGLYAISTEHESFKSRSLKGFYQMLKLVVICIGAIIIISTLINKNPIAILTGLGAGTAILMLVFQDTIKGLVAGIQLMANDMLRPGDWITVPKYGADGDVMEITLTTVKVRNWDKTIITVPPYALVNDSFQNWRGMFDTGGRRVKRSVNIDMHSVRFCTAEEMAYYRQQPWMEGYEDTGVEAVNLSVFRKYLDYYLRHNTKVHQEMLILVRQLQPTADGLPLELYFFSADTAWVRYEALQAEVFEHLLAVVHKFDLKVFQSPTGLDLQTLAKK